MWRKSIDWLAKKDLAVSENDLANSPLVLMIAESFRQPITKVVRAILQRRKTIEKAKSVIGPDLGPLLTSYDSM
jgi:hypothetical protein